MSITLEQIQEYRRKQEEHSKLFHPKKESNGTSISVYDYYGVSKESLTEAEIWFLEEVKDMIGTDIQLHDDHITNLIYRGHSKEDFEDYLEGYYEYLQEQQWPC